MARIPENDSIVIVLRHYDSLRFWAGRYGWSTVAALVHPFKNVKSAQRSAALRHPDAEIVTWVTARNMMAEAMPVHVDVAGVYRMRTPCECAKCGAMTYYAIIERGEDEQGIFNTSIVWCGCGYESTKTTMSDKEKQGGRNT